MGIDHHGGVVKYTISMKDLKNLEMKLYRASFINTYSKDNPALLKDYRAVGGSGAFRHIGFVEKPLEDELSAFIDKWEDYDSAVRLVERDVELWKNCYTSKNEAPDLVEKIKLNKRLAYDAINKLKPRTRKILLKLLEENEKTPVFNINYLKPLQIKEI
jgi:hypothetical protein